MRLPEIKSAIDHLMRTSNCIQCQGQFKVNDINIVATTKTEGLFELHCPSCHSGSMVSVFLTPEVEVRNHRSIKSTEKVSENDILDVKNFLNKFDGNFKKIFTKD